MLSNCACNRRSPMFRPPPIASAPATRWIPWRACLMATSICGGGFWTPTPSSTRWISSPEMSSIFPSWVRRRLLPGRGGFKNADPHALLAGHAGGPGYYELDKFGQRHRRRQTGGQRDDRDSRSPDSVFGCPVRGEQSRGGHGIRRAEATRPDDSRHHHEGRAVLSGERQPDGHPQRGRQIDRDGTRGTEKELEEPDSEQYRDHRGESVQILECDRACEPGCDDQEQDPAPGWENGPRFPAGDGGQVSCQVFRGAR